MGPFWTWTMFNKGNAENHLPLLPFHVPISSNPIKNTDWKRGFEKHTFFFFVTLHTRVWKWTKYLRRIPAAQFPYRPIELKYVVLVSLHKINNWGVTLLYTLSIKCTVRFRNSAKINGRLWQLLMEWFLRISVNKIKTNEGLICFLPTFVVQRIALSVVNKEVPGQVRVRIPHHVEIVTSIKKSLLYERAIQYNNVRLLARCDNGSVPMDYYYCYYLGTLLIDPNLSPKLSRPGLQNMW